MSEAIQWPARTHVVYTVHPVFHESQPFWLGTRKQVLCCFVFGGF